MRYSMKRAIAFALSLTMAFALPLTASAENSLITDIYEDDSSVGRIPAEEISEISKSQTNTDTTTQTQPLPGEDWGDILEEDGANKILGIVLDADEIVLEAGPKKKTVEATVLFEGEVSKEQQTGIYNFIQWKWEDPKGEDADRLRISRRDEGKCDLFGLEGCTGYLTAWVDNQAEGTTGRNNGVLDSDEVYVTVPVTVREYATRIKVREGVDGMTFFTKQKVNLNRLVALYDQDNNEITGWKEEIGWTVVGKNAKVDAKGVATLSKAGTVTFHGIGQRGARVELTLTVADAKKSADSKPVTGFEKTDKKALLDFNTVNKKIGDDNKLTDTLTVTPKTKDGAPTTDIIEWSSKKPEIVSVDGYTGDDEVFPIGLKTSTAQITAHKVGKTTVTATSSSGKKFNFTVTVKATLSDVKISCNKKDVYLGQSIQLNVERAPKQNTDKLTWISSDKKAVKVSNGIANVTLKATAGSKYTITAGKKNGKQSDPFTITPKYAYLASDAFVTPVKSLKKQSILKPQNYYQARNTANTAVKEVGVLGENGEALAISAEELLSWTSSKSTVATISASGAAKGVGTGSTKLTVTAPILKKGKLAIAKATVSLAVKQPVTRLQMKQTAVTAVKNAKTGRFSQPTLKVAKFLPKGSSKGVVKWTPDDNTVVSGVTNKGKVTVAGSEANRSTVVVARETNGATAKVTVSLCNATKNVIVSMTNAADLATVTGNSDKTKNLKANVKLFTSNKEKNKGFTVSAQGFDKDNQKSESVISCTPNKKGIVQVVDNEDGTYSIIPVKAGKVTLTFKTASGKSGKCTLNITL